MSNNFFAGRTNIIYFESQMSYPWAINCQLWSCFKGIVIVNLNSGTTFSAPR